MRKTIYSDDHKRIIKKLRKARIEARMSQRDAGKKLNKTQSYVSKIESGQRRVDIIQLKEFARIYKKGLKYFIK